MARIRVLVVDDSPTLRHHLVEVLSRDPDIEVVGDADSGTAAYARCCELRPDVITLDMAMPGGSGLEATVRIMADCPTPILIVSASSNRRDIWNTFDALAAGAMDVLDKPRGDATDAKWEQRLRGAVRLLSRVKAISHPRGRLPLRARPVDPASRDAGVARRFAPRCSYRLVAIGASTGGPGTVSQLLRGLPSGFPLPILVVIHIGTLFAAQLSDWLDSVSPIRVRQAVDGEPLPRPGHASVLVATPEQHLLVEHGRLRLTDGPERHHCKPSVDVLFESLARDQGANAIGCLLTGMGRDGAEGLLAMRRAGALTIAQDEASSIVYGMPRAAALLDAAELILPLGEIAATIGAHVQGGLP